MEAKILTIAELPEAVKLARGVFNFCLRRTVQLPEMEACFEQYVNEEHLRPLMEQGQLVLWGSYDAGQLVAVSGMQREGHITMLYVLPIYQRRGYGKLLLRTMRIYAREQFQLSRVSVNATPAWTAQYFRLHGFQMADCGWTNTPLFAPLTAKTIHEVRFERKRIPTGWLLGTTLGGLAACAALAVIYMISYLW